MKRLSVAFLCWTAVLLSNVSCASAPIDDFVGPEVVNAIRWEAFWEGADALGTTYSAGRRVEMRVMRTPNRLYAIIGQIQLALDIAIQEPDHGVQAVRLVRFPAMANDEATQWFLRTQLLAAPGCTDVGKGARDSTAGSTLPPGRPCPARPEGLLSDETLPFALPTLALPEAIQKRTVPVDSDELFAAVRRHLESERKTCGQLKARIPFYSNTDPWVYVLVSPGGKCPRGVATFYRSPSTGWDLGKFTADSPKEQLSAIIAKIESRTAAIVP